MRNNELYWSGLKYSLHNDVSQNDYYYVISVTIILLGIHIVQRPCSADVRVCPRISQVLFLHSHMIDVPICKLPPLCAMIAQTEGLRFSPSHSLSFLLI